MTANPLRNRSGITLTEILISIMIMGVGMVSLATLFPLGLLRIRDANRMSRSALLAESAFADMSARNLLSKDSFLNPLLNPYRNPLVGDTANSPPLYPAQDPWIIDNPSFGASAYDTSTGAVLGATSLIYDGTNYTKVSGNGLPVAYDPLWRASVPNGAYTSNPNFNGVGYYLNDLAEARFGSGIGFVGPDTSGLGGTSVPSAHGLQRLTNFNPNCTPPAAPANNYPVLYPNFNASTTITQTPNSTVAAIFVSPEDIVFQSNVDTSGNKTQGLSTVVPDIRVDLTTGVATSPMNDWRYTWMFTGHQADEKGMVFEGEIVVFENRPFAIDPIVNAPFASMLPTNALQPTGETVVQAVFGFSPNVDSGGYGRGADRNILLRWPASMPDPEVRVGSWIADVTYERNAAVSLARFGAGYPGQRCYWYQIIKRSTPADESAGSGLGASGYRSMMVWVSSKLRAQTQLTSNGYVMNAALVCPYVVNVFPRTVYTR